MSDVNIGQNLQAVHQRIQRACEKAGRDASGITLIAVSKTKPNSDILKAIEHGQLAFGENRMKELEDKMESIALPDISWHMIGNLQTNKIKYIAHRVDWIHSVEKLKYIKEISKRAGQSNRIVNVLIQVNISGESQKGGCEPDELASILKGAVDYEHVRVKGLMGMATFTDDPEDVRGEFKLLKQLFDEHQHLNGEHIQLEHLSIGMSNDLEVAIEEGATMVRVGSDIFGPRNYN